MNGVVLLIRSLGIGGAERQLIQLATGLSKMGVGVRVLTFYPGGQLRGELEALDVRVEDLAKRGRWDVLPFLTRLVATLRREHPSVLYCFLPAANILGTIARPFVPGTRVVWGVRASNVDLSRYDWLSRRMFAVEKRLARFADVIIVNSQAGNAYHLQHDFPAGKMVVVPNGIDTGRFRPDPQARSRVRAEWGVANDEMLIGLAARLDPMKDHPTFLCAAAGLAKAYPRARFVCVGHGLPTYRGDLVDLGRQLGLSGRLIWAGERHDMPSAYSAFDIACSSSSYGEGFSNSIAEAMSCERPCVVTDVGDSAWIVGETGRVVPPGDAPALEQAWASLLSLGEPGRRALGGRARQRVKALFSVDTMVQRTREAVGL